MLNWLRNRFRRGPVVPVVRLSGVITTGGLLGSRNNYINWAQEQFDQGGMLREFVKWDYELRHHSQVESVVDRALAITYQFLATRFSSGKSIMKKKPGAG